MPAAAGHKGPAAAPCCCQVPRALFWIVSRQSKCGVSWHANREQSAATWHFLAIAGRGPESRFRLLLSRNEVLGPPDVRDSFGGCFLDPCEVY